jgi:hypothetical protein
MRVLLTLLLLASHAHAYAQRPEGVLLSDVRSLSLQRGALAAARREPARPQIACEDAPCPERLECSRDEDWTCSGALPRGFGLENVRIRCEGFSHAADAYVLRGSCGAELEVVVIDDFGVVALGLAALTAVMVTLMPPAVAMAAAAGWALLRLLVDSGGDPVLQLAALVLVSSLADTLLAAQRK